MVCQLALFTWTIGEITKNCVISIVPKDTTPKHREGQVYLKKGKLQKNVSMFFSPSLSCLFLWFRMILLMWHQGSFPLSVSGPTQWLQNLSIHLYYHSFIYFINNYWVHISHCSTNQGNSMKKTNKSKTTLPKDKVPTLRNGHSGGEFKL